MTPPVAITFTVTDSTPPITTPPPATCTTGTSTKATVATQPSLIDLNGYTGSTVTAILTLGSTGAGCTMKYYYGTSSSATSASTLSAITLSGTNSDEVTFSHGTPLTTGTKTYYLYT